MPQDYSNMNEECDNNPQSQEMVDSYREDQERDRERFEEE